jgi:hypothetical protein
LIHNNYFLHFLKKYISIIFLFLWIFIQGIACMNTLQLWVHKKNEQKRKVNYFVTIPKSNWKTIKKINADEIEINGKRFDVKLIEFKNHQLILFGHYDTRENEIVKQHTDFEKKKQDQNKSASFAFLFYEKIENPILYHPKDWISKTENLIKETVLKGNVEEWFIPPRA